jgi:hypothetical protein
MRIFLATFTPQASVAYATGPCLDYTRTAPKHHPKFFISKTSGYLEKFKITVRGRDAS